MEPDVDMADVDNTDAPLPVEAVADPAITEEQWAEMDMPKPIIISYNKKEIARIDSVRDAMHYWMFKGTPGRRLRDMKLPVSLEIYQRVYGLLKKYQGKRVSRSNYERNIKVKLFTLTRGLRYWTSRGWDSVPEHRQHSARARYVEEEEVGGAEAEARSGGSNGEEEDEEDEVVSEQESEGQEQEIMRVFDGSDSGEEDEDEEEEEEEVQVARPRSTRGRFAPKSRGRGRGRGGGRASRRLAVRESSPESSPSRELPTRALQVSLARQKGLEKTIRLMAQQMVTLKDTVDTLQASLAAMPKCCVAGTHHPFWAAEQYIEEGKDGINDGSSVSDRLEQLITTRSLVELRNGGATRPPRSMAGRYAPY